MAQSDQVVQNATFPTVRGDINDNLAALFSQSEGGSAPAVTRAFQPWVDTSSSPAVWKVRNSSNSAWITVGVLDTNFQVGGITPIANGGTGATTATAALAALLPSQGGNTGKALITDGSAAAWGTVAANPRFAIFGSSTTWTCPAGITQAIVSVVGGGGGGGGNDGYGDGGNGGGGGIGIGSVALTPATIYTITVGGGGAGNNNGSGSAGGTSSFGPQGGTVLISATGGSGGGYNNSAKGANGTCSSASADLRQSNISGVTVPYVSGPTIVRTNATSSTAALVWAVTTAFSPGSSGAGGSSDGDGVDNNNATGGIGGAIVIQYWGA